MPVASRVQAGRAVRWTGGAEPNRVGFPAPLPSRRLQLGGWLMRQPTSPNCQIQRVGCNTLSVLLNWSQHACPQNVQATAPGDPCSLLEPCPAHKNSGVTPVKCTGIVHFRSGLGHLASSPGADIRATFLSVGLPYDPFSTECLE